MAGPGVHDGPFAEEFERWEALAEACACVCPASTGISAREVAHAAERVRLKHRVRRSNNGTALIPCSMPDARQWDHRPPSMANKLNIHSLPNQAACS